MIEHVFASSMSRTHGTGARHRVHGDPAATSCSACHGSGLKLILRCSQQRRVIEQIEGSQGKRL